MPWIGRNTCHPSALTRAVLLLLLLALPLGAGADSEQKRRILVGLKLFPAVIAADERLQEETPGSLRLAILYHDDSGYAAELAESLRRVESIKGRRLIVETESIAQLLQSTSPPPDALFLSQRQEGQVGLVAGYGIGHGIITFSPFHGDVEHGILAGLAISDRIRPYLNSETLRRSSIVLKPFFLKVAETYEP